MLLRRRMSAFPARLLALPVSPSPGGEGRGEGGSIHPTPNIQRPTSNAQHARSHIECSTKPDFRLHDDLSFPLEFALHPALSPRQCNQADAIRGERDEGGRDLRSLCNVRVHFTVLTRGARPWIRTSRRSPDSMGPTPLGVPVRITSPGNRVMFVEMKLTR